MSQGGNNDNNKPRVTSRQSTTSMSKIAANLVALPVGVVCMSWCACLLSAMLHDMYKSVPQILKVSRNHNM